MCVSTAFFLIFALVGSKSKQQQKNCKLKLDCKIAKILEF